MPELAAWLAGSPGDWNSSSWPHRIQECTQKQCSGVTIGGVEIVATGMTSEDALGRAEEGSWNSRVIDEEACVYLALSCPYCRV
jgi:hypothetical protein